MSGGASDANPEARGGERRYELGTFIGPCTEEAATLKRRIRRGELTLELLDIALALKELDESQDRARCLNR